MLNSEEILEFYKIKQNIAEYSVNDENKEKITLMKPYKNLYDLKEMQEKLDDCDILTLNYGRLPLSTFHDITKLLAKAKKGGILQGIELANIFMQLNNAKELDGYLNDIHYDHNVIYDLCKNIDFPKNLYELFVTSIDSQGNILETASAELMHIQSSMTQCENGMRTKISQLAGKYRDYLSQENVFSRNDHLVLAVKTSHKSKVPGVVHSVSASGQTLFIEPEDVMRINERLMSLQQQYHEEIQKILKNITKQVAHHEDVLRYNQQFLYELDYVHAVTCYCQKLNTVIPEVDEQYDSLVLQKARHPLIDEKDVVANDIVIHAPEKIYMISGSNTGGKTVVLKTVGLLSMMALCGLGVPCKDAKIPFFDEIYCDLGDEQSIAQSLSTFSSHMKRLADICDHITERSLIVVDEIGSGTDPKEGSAIASSMLHYFYRNSGFCFVTTHYSELKQYAKESDYIKVASVEFDIEKMQPTYRLIENSTGNSFAIEISSRLGLREDIVKEAFEIKQQQTTDTEKLMERLEKEISENENIRQELQKALDQAKKNEEKYKKQLQHLENQKEKILEDAKKDANEILDNAKGYIDDVVKELRESSLKQHEVIDAKHSLDEAKFESKKKKVQAVHKNYEKGDRVLVLSVKREGTVIGITKKGLNVSLGGMSLIVKAEDVEFIGKAIREKNVVKANTRSIKKASTAHYECNIIGMRYDEAMIEVDKFLDNALLHNYSTVRIVHGMGTGALRKGVRKMLDRNPRVVRYTDGGPTEGGLGATLVYFE